MTIDDALDELGPAVNIPEAMPAGPIFQKKKIAALYNEFLKADAYLQADKYRETEAAAFRAVYYDFSRFSAKYLNFCKGLAELSDEFERLPSWFRQVVPEKIRQQISAADICDELYEKVGAAFAPLSELDDADNPEIESLVDEANEILDSFRSAGNDGFKDKVCLINKKLTGLLEKFGRRVVDFSHREHVVAGADYIGRLKELYDFSAGKNKIGYRIGGMFNFIVLSDAEEKPAPKTKKWYQFFNLMRRA